LFYNRIQYNNIFFNINTLIGKSGLRIPIYVQKAPQDARGAPACMGFLRPF